MHSLKNDGWKQQQHSSGWGWMVGYIFPKFSNAFELVCLSVWMNECFKWMRCMENKGKKYLVRQITVTYDMNDDDDDGGGGGG